MTALHRQRIHVGGIDTRDVDRAYAAAVARADRLELRLHDLDAHIREARSLARQIGLAPGAAD